VDAAVSYEPCMTKAANEGGGEVIFTTKGTNLIADVIVIRVNTIETRRNDLLTYIRALDKGVQMVKSGDEAAIELAAARLNVSKEETKEQIKGVKILDSNDNKTMAFASSNPNNVMKNFELTLATAIDMKLIEKPLDLAALYDDSLVMSL
jgi:NitT/TauT family transport system substrate-binding protein